MLDGVTEVSERKSRAQVLTRVGRDGPCSHFFAISIWIGNTPGIVHLSSASHIISAFPFTMAAKNSALSLFSSSSVSSRICSACRRSQAASQLTSKSPVTAATVLSRRQFSSTQQKRYDIPSQEYLAANTQPRWKQTPKGMTMPIRLRPKITNNEWTCNDSPEKLDTMYKRLLGPEGPQMLTEETKWLAITHKSFDQGRRGFNERLGYMGRRIVELQSSLGLLQTVTAPLLVSQVDDYGRTPFVHPALQGLAGLNERTKRDLLTKERLAGLADQYGITRVMRWKPKKVRYDKDTQPYDTW